MSQPSFSRRQFIGHTGLVSGALLGSQLPSLGAAEAKQSARRPKVAVIFTEFRFRSHAYNILMNCMGSYWFRGKLTDPGIDVVSFYADQFPHDDMAREASQRFKVPLFKTIDEALCLGGKDLAVDGVLSIGEHGNYPLNELGQRMYPRKRFFDETVAVMKRSNRFVPFFNDKHLSYRWDWAKEMYDTARKLGIPLMAGSSVPLGERRPQLEIPPGAQIEEAVSIHGGGMESYDFHALEVLQSMIESRHGGETGIRNVELITGKAFTDAVRERRWSRDLVEAAMAAESKITTKRQPRPRSFDIPRPGIPKKRPSGPHALIVNYYDGLRATILKIGSSSSRWNFACRLRSETKPRATAFFNGPWGNTNLFAALSRAIQHLYITGQEPYPVERTLLVSGALDAAMHSHKQGGSVVETPELKLAYAAKDFRALRENGASWKVITVETPQPTEFKPGTAATLGRP